MADAVQMRKFEAEPSVVIGLSDKKYGSVSHCPGDAQFCPYQGLIYENIYKQLKFEYIYNILKYSILKLYAMKCILSVFSCFAKMRTRCGHESIAVFESKSYLCRA